MTIEVYLKGKLIKSEFFALPEPDPSLSFEQRFNERERMVNRLVDNFRINYMTSRQRESDQVEIAVVFESKMNPVPEIVPVVKIEPHKSKKWKDTPRVNIPELEPVKWVRAKAEYSNKSYSY